MTWRPCEDPNSKYADWCRECIYYGTGRCRYDWETQRMMVRCDEE